MLKWILLHTPEVLFVLGALSLCLAVIVAMGLDLMPSLRRAGAVTLYTGLVLMGLAFLTWGVSVLDNEVHRRLVHACLA